MHTSLMNSYKHADLETRRAAAGWLTLSVAALGLSGLFALLLVFSRTPVLGDLLPGHGFFARALVLHVDLSVLVWFTAFCATIWTLAGGGRLRGLNRAAFWLAATGFAVMVAAAILDPGQALLSNYIPILDGPVFLTGLALFGAGCALVSLRTLAVCDPDVSGARGRSLLEAASFWSAGVISVSLTLILWTGLQLSPELGGVRYFDTLFWGGGHIAQFAPALMMAAVWYQLCRECGGHKAPPEWAFRTLLGALFLPALAGVGVQALFSPESDIYRQSFTGIMAYGAWLTLVPFSLLALYYGWRAPRGGSEAPALILSAVLFLSGAITGSLIRDDSVLVPAHYHGAIGAVTLTFMAFAYRLMRELGFTGPQITQERLQLSLYGGGLLALVAGLTISGLSGVMRKVPGAEQSLEGVTSIIGMVLMGAGGFVALSATFAFAIFALRALLPAGIPTLRPSESD